MSQTQRRCGGPYCTIRPTYCILKLAVDSNPLDPSILSMTSLGKNNQVSFCTDISLQFYQGIQLQKLTREHHSFGCQVWGQEPRPHKSAPFEPTHLQLKVKCRRNQVQCGEMVELSYSAAEFISAW